MQTTEKAVPITLLKKHIPEELLIDSGLCPSCFAELQETVDGAKVCPHCAFEFWNGGQIEDNRIPLPQEEGYNDGHMEGSYSPENWLAFNKNLGVGQWISRHALCRIIARKNGGSNEDLGVRATELKILTSIADHPKIVKLLEIGSELCKKFCMDTDRNEYIVFSNELGKALRKIGAYLIVKGDTPEINLPSTAKAVFVLLVRKYFPDKFSVAVRTLNPDSNAVGYIYWLLEGLQSPPKKGAH
jgi:hypothetical protein